jgi:hypothetical protein
MLTFVGLVCSAVAFGAEPCCADVFDPEGELPDAALALSQLTLHSLIDWPTVELFELVDCGGEAAPPELCALLPGWFAEAVFDWSTAPVLPGLAIRTLTFTLLAPG